MHVATSRMETGSPRRMTRVYKKLSDSLASSPVVYSSSPVSQYITSGHFCELMQLILAMQIVASICREAFLSTFWVRCSANSVLSTPMYSRLSPAFFPCGHLSEPFDISRCVSMHHAASMKGRRMPEHHSSPEQVLFVN